MFLSFNGGSIPSPSYDLALRLGVLKAFWLISSYYDWLDLALFFRFVPRDFVFIGTDLFNEVMAEDEGSGSICAIAKASW